MRAKGCFQLVMSVALLTAPGCAGLEGLGDAGPCEPEFHAAAPGAGDRFSFDAEDGLRGYRNGFGAVMIEPKYQVASEFSLEGIAAVVDPVEGPIFIDVDGHLLAHAYKRNRGPDYFQEDRARIVEDGFIGYIDRDGAVIIEPRFDEATPFCNGVAEVCIGCQDSGGARFRIDEVGRRLPEP